MKIEDLFKKTLTSASLDDLANEAESFEQISAWRRDKDRFVPAVDFSNVENFAKFGSAEQYYSDAIERIYNTYPYDGSSFEREQWHLSSSYFDNHVFENEYPRTNGHVIFSAHSGGIVAADCPPEYAAAGWGARVDIYKGYGAPASGAYEYISIQGGPHTSKRVKGKDIQDVSGDYTSGYANVLDLGKGRESNLKIDGTIGNTVEFWMKKTEFVTSLTNKEVIFDVALVEDNPQYGRLTIEMSGGAGYNDSPFYVTYMSGATRGAGFFTASLGNNITTTTVADGAWHHYAFTFANVNDNLEAKLYIDSRCNHTITGSSANIHKGASTSTVGYLSGTLTGTIGALCTNPDLGMDLSASARSHMGLGWGKLSASIDEFRFWKRKRTSEDIGLNYFRNIYGGANTDRANTDLGVYYKFNEGTTQTSSVDQTILDYSGRICNGTYTGYKTTTRSNNSAIVESSASKKEFKDPILYPFHNRVQDYQKDRTMRGSEYDVRNNAGVFTSLPSWLQEEDQSEGDNTIRKLTQIMGSYLDTLWLQIGSLNKIKDESYFSSSNKPIPHARRLLQERGLVSPELFIDATIVEHLFHQDHNDNYEEKLHNVKNLIYQNIFNNLNYIYKSKGTEKSFRNLIRCFGVDDEIVKMNIYAHNTTYNLKDNFRDTVVRKRYVDFTTSETKTATVYQMTASSDGRSTSFLSGAIDSGSAMTFETEVIFPPLEIANWKKTSQTSTPVCPPPSDLTSSIFGVHTPKITIGDEGDTSWKTPDVANFQVHAVRKTRTSDIAEGGGWRNSDVRFMLTSSNDSMAVELTSSTFRSVYDNNKWNFAVRVLPKGHPQSYKLGGTYFANQDYRVEFYGVNINKEVIENSFYVTGTIPYSKGQAFLTSSKRLYIGAERTDFSGAVNYGADSRISSTRVWADYLNNGVINAHARDASNYGTLNAYWNAYPGSVKFKNSYIPQMETLALHWDFNQVTSSNDDGFFTVVDVSSGTLDSNRYGNLSQLITKKHPGLGYGFPTSASAALRDDGSTVTVKEFVQSSKQVLPENLHTSNTIKIINNQTEDDTVFTRETRPISHYFTFEKSMYQVISEEMINFFATIIDFNNLIGEPVNRYRHEYKDLSKIRHMFFKRVGNTPNLVKFVDYYKWLDSALGVFLQQLMPASAEHSHGLRNMVESHVLERNKYRNKFPTLEMKRDDPEGHLFGINELLYNWKYGHSSSVTNDATEKENCLWWKDRSEKYGPHTSGDSVIDQNRTVYQEQYTSKNVSGSTYAIRAFTRPYRYTVQKEKVIHGGTNFSENKQLDYMSPMLRKLVPPSEIPTQTSVAFGRETFVSSSRDLCLDNPELDTKEKLAFGATGSLKIKGELIAPFNVLSVTSGTIDSYNIDTRGVKSPDFPPPNTKIVNLHHDTYGDDAEVPMQGPFTEMHVGGKQHRHIRGQFQSKWTRATAEINFGKFTSFPLNAKIIITSTDGTTKTYTAKNTETAASLQFNRTLTASPTVAASLYRCIIHANGHNGKILASTKGFPINGGQLFLTQNVEGVAGNRSIKFEDSSGAPLVTSEVFESFIDFNGGYGAEDITNRPEGWRLNQTASKYELVNPAYDHGFNIQSRLTPRDLLSRRNGKTPC
jgi:hypothetical protein